MKKWVRRKLHSYWSLVLRWCVLEFNLYSFVALCTVSVLIHTVIQIFSSISHESIQIYSGRFFCDNEIKMQFSVEEKQTLVQLFAVFPHNYMKIRCLSVKKVIGIAKSDAHLNFHYIRCVFIVVILTIYAST